jgi:EpsI family protein
MRTRIVVLAALLLGAAAMRHQVLEPPPPWPEGTSPGQFPTTLNEWHSTGDVPFSTPIETLLGADEYVNRRYQRADTSVGLYIGYYLAQRQGAAIHSPLNCLPGAGWRSTSFERVPVDGSGAIVNRVVVQKGETRQAVYYWYQSRHRIVASEYWSKFYLVADAVRTRRSDAALVRVTIPISRGADGTRTAFDEGRAFASLALSSVGDVFFQ